MVEIRAFSQHKLLLENPCWTITFALIYLWKWPERKRYKYIYTRNGERAKRNEMKFITLSDQSLGLVGRPKTKRLYDTKEKDAFRFSVATKTSGEVVSEKWTRLCVNEWEKKDEKAPWKVLSWISRNIFHTKLLKCFVELREIISKLLRLFDEFAFLWNWIVFFSVEVSTFWKGKKALSCNWVLFVDFFN